MSEVYRRCPNTDGNSRNLPKPWRKLSKDAEVRAENTGNCRTSDESCRSKGGRCRKWAKHRSSRGLRSPGLARPARPLPALPTRLWPLGKAEALGPVPERSWGRGWARRSGIQEYFRRGRVKFEGAGGVEGAIKGLKVVGRAGGVWGYNWGRKGAFRGAGGCGGQLQTRRGI